MASDGQLQAVLGRVNIQLHRLDGAARLLEITVCACVVQDLHVVNADVLIGVDVVTGSNGLHLEYQKDDLCWIQFGLETPVVGSTADSHPMSHVTVTYEGDDYRVVVERRRSVVVGTQRLPGIGVAMERWRKPSAPIGYLCFNF